MTVAGEPSRRTVVERFVKATDLDELADLYAELAEDPTGPADEIESVLDDWDDKQAVANVLMYPTLAPAGSMVPALLRGLRESPGSYLRLAAAVGVGDVDAGPLTNDDRVALVEALLDVVASEPGVTAGRASVALRQVVVASDVPDLIGLLPHPAPTVRRNLAIIALELLGPDALRELLADRRQVEEDEAAGAQEQFAASGVDITRTVADQRLLLGLGYLPNLQDWTS